MVMPGPCFSGARGVFLYPPDLLSFTGRVRGIADVRTAWGGCYRLGERKEAPVPLHSNVILAIALCLSPSCKLFHQIKLPESLRSVSHAEGCSFLPCSPRLPLSRIDMYLQNGCNFFAQDENQYALLIPSKYG